MLVSIYYPFSDERCFYPDRDLVIQSRFTKIGATQRFQKNLGSITERPNGGFSGWIGENSICEIRSSVEILPKLKIKTTDSEFDIPLKVAFKRFYFDALHTGYFSVGIDLSDTVLGNESEVALLRIIEELAGLPVKSIHRPSRQYSLASYQMLVADLYLSGSTRKLKIDGASNIANKKVNFGEPIIILTLPDSAVENNARWLGPAMKCEIGKRAIYTTYINWPLPVFMFVICASEESMQERFLRAGISRLYAEVYRLERMVGLLQSHGLEAMDSEGRSILGNAMNIALKRLQGADKPKISQDRAAFEYLVLAFSRMYRPGHVSDLEGIITALRARPNLRKIMRESYLFRSNPTNRIASMVEITMGNKTVNYGQKGGVSVVGGALNTGGGDVIGNDKTTTVLLSLQEVESAIAPIVDAIDKSTSKDKDKKDALQLVGDLKNESMKGAGADDSKVAKLVDRLIALVPTAVAGVVSAFATPILGSVAGPVTKYVLDKFR